MVNAKHKVVGMEGQGVGVRTFRQFIWWVISAWVDYFEVKHKCVEKFVDSCLGAVIAQISICDLLHEQAFL